MIKTCIVPCLIDGAKANTASYRFRAKWLAKYWLDAELWPGLSRPLGDFDAFIFQKAYLSDRARQMIKLLRSQGKTLAFDITDPDWLISEEHKRRLLDVLPLFDFAVTPTQALTTWLRMYVPAHVIPDRLDLSEFRMRRTQSNAMPSCIWFGYSHNIGPLEEMWPCIERHGLYLTILSNECPEPWCSRSRVRFVQWEEERANAEIVKHDIALVPPLNPYKSNNRTITAWALGLATAEDGRSLESLLDPGARRRCVESSYREAHDHCDVRISVATWKTLIETYNASSAIAREDR